MLADLKFSARSLTRTPGLALALLLTIAVGIGANASVLGFIRGSFAHPLPLPAGATLVSLFARNADGEVGAVSYQQYQLLQAQRDTFEWLGAARALQKSINVGEQYSIVPVVVVTPELADLLQLSMGDGIVISDRVWRSEFGSTDRIRGERIAVDGVDTHVAGVAPEWLEGLYTGRPVDIWMPLESAAVDGLNRTSRTFWPLGRLRPGVSLDRAAAAVSSIGDDISAITVLPYTGVPPEALDGVSRIGRLLPAAAGAVFLIACANVAALLLSRGSARAREMSIRVALGASRRQLGRAVLVESMLVSVTGGAVGALLAFWTTRIIPALLFEQDAERLVFSSNFASLLTAAAACAGVTAACGLLPYFDIRHDEPAAVLQRESAGPSKAMRRLRSGLVVIQMASCCLLVVSTALLLEGFHEALRTRAGNRLGRPVLATLQARLGFARPDLGLKYFRDADHAVQTLPGISGTAWAATPPGSQPPWSDMQIEPPRLPVREVVLDVAAFTPPSLALVNLPPVAGRMFSGGDTPQACRVAIVNQDASDELFGRDTVGRSIEDPAGERVEIVGVVATKTTDRKTRSRPIIFYYAAQTSALPGGTGPATFRVPVLPKTASVAIGANIVSAGYLDAAGISLTAGRAFRDDPTPHGCRVGLINEEASEAYFGGRALGGAVVDGAGRRTEIIGIVHSRLLRTSQRFDVPMIYFPLGQDFRPSMNLILSAPASADGLVAAVRDRLGAVPGGVPGALAVTTLDRHLGRTALAGERIATVLVGACAATALSLGILGLAGAMGDSVRQRRQEIALRIALGAQGWRLTRQLLAEGARLAGAGAIAGLIGSLLVARWIRGITPGAGSLTMGEWLMGPLVLAAAVAIASVMPARRAMSVDPLALMRKA
jgi:putative ABC transport system permease protein